MLNKDIEIIPYYLLENNTWDDLGTVKSFTDKNLEILIKKTFINFNDIEINEIEGDGSDRNWIRIKDKNNSLIAVSHGLNPPDGDLQAKSFVKIGMHLHEKNIPVPKIYEYDFFSGIALLEDLGDLRFQDFISEKNEKDKKTFCEKIIKELFDFSLKGIIGFSHEMTYQTPVYDQKLSFEECLYFKNEFLKEYLKADFDNEKLDKEFRYISENTQKNSLTGLMHRDFQSRNIMMKNNRPFFIDFQGARKGPVQYDLASFIIDPYMNLDQNIQNHLLDFASEKASEYKINKNNFKKSFYFCGVSRNLQILGAFSFLSMKKNKKYFETYIPAAINSLKKLLGKFEDPQLNYLKSIISKY